LIVSNVWNSLHQVMTNYNALGEKTVNYYQTGSPYLPLGTMAPNGLASTNNYYTNGYTNYLQSTVISALGVTNSFTYTDGLVYTATDQRGLTATNTTIRCNALTTSRPDGTITATYSNLNLLQTVDRLGHTNRFGYDAFGRKIWEADALGRTNAYAYSSAGDLQSVTDALGRAGNGSQLFVKRPG